MYRTKLVSDVEVAAILTENCLESILTENERTRMNSFLSSRRKREWLGGRIAAKWLLGDWLKGHFAIELHSNEIEILNDGDGRPYSSFCCDNETLRQIEAELSISISHIEGFAIAAFSTSRRVGVDVVRVKEISPKMQHYFLSEKEIGVAESFGREGPALLWAVKEAFLKAIGTGFTVPPKSFSIQADANNPSKILISGAHKFAEETEVFFEKPNDRVLTATVLTNK